VGFLLLEDGTMFRGESVGATGTVLGEAVFTTAMSGYQEIVTDPSYAEQIVCFSAPMVGNYGVSPDRSESAHVHARGVVMREARGPAWTSWLTESGVPALTGVDTRAVVLHLRERGAMRAAVVADETAPAEVLPAIRAFPAMAGRGLAAKVSVSKPVTVSDRGRARVAVVDLGCKRSILRRLVNAGAAVTLHPHDADPDELRQYDGVVFSNGPGDPEPLHVQVATLSALLGDVPVLGICLGHQLLGLAAGLSTFKLPFGHHGANHPVLERGTGRVLVTSQNHGFAVSATEEHEATHVSLYDGTVEGLHLPALRARSVQFHPEAGPGPHDAWSLIDSWIEEVTYASSS
jgi:carbamoyl-phosphate synthase small subunit